MNITKEQLTNIVSKVISEQDKLKRKDVPSTTGEVGGTSSFAKSASGDTGVSADEAGADSDGDAASMPGLPPKGEEIAANDRSQFVTAADIKGTIQKYQQAGELDPKDPQHGFAAGERPDFSSRIPSDKEIASYNQWANRMGYNKDIRNDLFVLKVIKTKRPFDFLQLIGKGGGPIDKKPPTDVEKAADKGEGEPAGGGASMKDIIALIAAMKQENNITVSPNIVVQGARQAQSQGIDVTNLNQFINNNNLDQSQTNNLFQQLADGGGTAAKATDVIKKSGAATTAVSLGRLDDDGLKVIRITPKYGSQKLAKDRFSRAQDQGVTGRNTEPSSDGLHKQFSSPNGPGTQRTQKKPLNMTYTNMVNQLKKGAKKVDPYFTVDGSVLTDIGRTAKVKGLQNSKELRNMVDDALETFLARKKKLTKDDATAIINKHLKNFVRGDEKRTSRIVRQLQNYGLVMTGDAEARLKKGQSRRRRK